MTEPAPPPRPRLGVIANPHQELDTWQEQVLELPELCPHSHNPGPGSALSITYTAGPWFLELFALEAYLPGFVAHPVVRDNELLAQTVDGGAGSCRGAGRAGGGESRSEGGRVETASARPGTCGLRGACRM